MMIFLFAEVKVWLKNLRLHKYLNLFVHMNYDEMVSLTEANLEALGMWTHMYYVWYSWKNALIYIYILDVNVYVWVFH